MLFNQSERDQALSVHIRTLFNVLSICTYERVKYTVAGLYRSCSTEHEAVAIALSFSFANEEDNLTISSDCKVAKVQYSPQKAYRVHCVEV